MIDDQFPPSPEDSAVDVDKHTSNYSINEDEADYTGMSDVVSNCCSQCL